MSGYVGGIWDIRHFSHPLLDRAIAAGDPEALDAAVAELRRRGAYESRDGFYLRNRQVLRNLTPELGANAVLDQAFGRRTVPTTFYVAYFESNSTPAADWGGDALKASGGKATEFTAYDEATRPTWTPADAADRMIGHSALAFITVSSGVLNRSLYGAVLTDVGTKQYSSTDKVIYSAVRLPRPYVVNAGEPVAVGFTYANVTACG